MQVDNRYDTCMVAICLHYINAVSDIPISWNLKWENAWSSTTPLHLKLHGEEDAEEEVEKENDVQTAYLGTEAEGEGADFDEARLDWHHICAFDPMAIAGKFYKKSHMI